MNLINSADTMIAVRGCLSLMVKGFTLAFYEVVEDFDIIDERSYLLYENTRFFKCVNGRIYCKGGSIMHPPTVTYDDGWEIRPLNDPEYFFEVMFSYNCLDKVFICENERPSLEVWNKKVSFHFDKKRLCPLGIKNMLYTKKNDLEIKCNVPPLKVLAALELRNTFGIESVGDICYMLDNDTRHEVFKPHVWWVPL